MNKKFFLVLLVVAGYVNMSQAMDDIPPADKLRIISSIARGIQSQHNARYEDAIQMEHVANSALRRLHETPDTYRVYYRPLIDPTKRALPYAHALATSLPSTHIPHRLKKFLLKKINNCY